MLISVVITNYNYGRFLGDAIDSVLSQTHSEVECVVVDDGSTDNSRDVIASRPRVVAIFKENGGQAQALRTGVEAARGEIVISLDADDWLLPEACARIAQSWRPGVVCLNYRLSLNGDREKIWPAEAFLEEGHAAFLAAYGYYPSAPMSGNAFDRDYVSTVLARAAGLDGDGVDAYLLYSAPVFGKIAHVDDVLGVYRTHGGNVSMTSGRKTVRNLGDHAYYQYWAQQNAQRFALERGVNLPRRDHLVGAYPSLWLLLAKDAGYDRRPLPDQSRLVTVAAAIKGFLLQPAIDPLRRAKNVGLLLVMALLPLAPRRWLADRIIFGGA
ncbi:glycosyltransferase family 2 protein [Methylocystis parvus]|nr:glycosyltransferase family 2 protein [Methylocystis parvus]WBJ98770.1 glycosyltransferase [Methylocystis parvus OBBP]